MKMIMVLFRSSLEEDVLGLMNDLNINALTEIPEVLGRGETGEAYGSLFSSGSNGLILTAVEDQQADEAVRALKAFRDRLSERQHGCKIPLRVFTFPCSMVV